MNRQFVLMGYCDACDVLMGCCQSQLCVDDVEIKYQTNTARTV
jgi:hypothetical protein